MVIRCPNPKVPFPPVLVDDDETVEWLISNHEVSLCVTVKLKTTILGDNGQLQPMANDQVEEFDINFHTQVLADDEVTKDVGMYDCPEGVDVNGDSFIPYEAFDNHNKERSPESENMMNDIGVDVDDAYLIPCEVAGNVVVDDVNAIELHGLSNMDRRVVANIVDCEPMVCPLRIPKGDDIRSDAYFNSKQHLKDSIEMLAVRFHFVFVSKKSNKSTYVVKCKNEECKWFLSAKRVGDLKMFQVKTYECPHSCSRMLILQNKDHRNASYKMVARLYADKFQDPGRIYRTKDIIHDFKQQFGYTLSSAKAHNAKTYARELILGNPKESFAELPKFFHALKLANPGTLTFIETHKTAFYVTEKGVTTKTEVDDVFLYCFMALGQCIKGYKSSIRPVIFVDGTFLKGRYKGTLLVATSQDGNHQIYPLAWGVVDSENKKAWTWFFEKLKTITGDTTEVAIIA